jgi:hypothetical protein
VRDTTIVRGGGRKQYFRFEGSQALPASPSDKGVNWFSQGTIKCGSDRAENTTVFMTTRSPHFPNVNQFFITSEQSDKVLPAQTRISCRKEVSVLINHPHRMTSQSIETPRHAERLARR